MKVEQARQILTGLHTNYARALYQTKAEDIVTAIRVVLADNGSGFAAREAAAQLVDLAADNTARIGQDMDTPEELRRDFHLVHGRYREIAARIRDMPLQVETFQAESEGLADAVAEWDRQRQKREDQPESQTP
jgi:hypothetical protein